MLQAQLSALESADALTTKDDDNIKIGSSTFDDSDINPEKLRTAHQAWVLLINTCKRVAFDIF